jgi:serine/threonine-protein kinase RsbW
VDFGRAPQGRPRQAGRAPAPNSFEPVTEETVELKLPSRIESISEAAGAVADAARRLGFAEDALYGIDLAVREAVTNAVLHGNLQDEATPVEIGMTGTDAGLVVTVRDRGLGFDPTHVADPTAEENLRKASGRGILFMRTFMDEVAWESPEGGGTLVRMIKKK